MSDFTLTAIDDGVFTIDASSLSATGFSGPFLELPTICPPTDNVAHSGFASSVVNPLSPDCIFTETATQIFTMDIRQWCARGWYGLACEVFLLSDGTYYAHQINPWAFPAARLVLASGVTVMCRTRRADGVPVTIQTANSTDSVYVLSVTRWGVGPTGFAQIGDEAVIQISDWIPGVREDANGYVQPFMWQRGGVLYLAAQQSGTLSTGANVWEIYESDDGGKSWQNCTATLGNPDGYPALFFAQNDGTHTADVLGGMVVAQLGGGATVILYIGFTEPYASGDPCYIFAQVSPDGTGWEGKGTSASAVFVGTISEPAPLSASYAFGLLTVTDGKVAYQTRNVLDQTAWVSVPVVNP